MASAPDTRSPLVVDLHDLDRRPGTMKLLQRTVPAPADLGVDMIGVPEGSDLLLDLRLEAVGEGVLVTGTVEADLAGQCTRCLDPLSDHEAYDLQELYFYPGRDAEDEALRIQDDLIDLDPAIRAAVVLELPFAPVCREDCLGLCPECGAKLNDDPEHTHGEAIDERWSALGGMMVDDN